jgi:integrase
MTDNERDLTNEEYATLVKSGHDHSPRHGFTVYLLGQTGLKRDEAANFTPEWFDQEEQVVTVPHEQEGWKPARQHAARQIPLSTPTANNIARYIEELDSSVFRVSGSTIYDRVVTAGEHAGISGVSPKTLRHTYVRRLYNSGLCGGLISEIIGVQSEAEGVSRSLYYNPLDHSDIDEYWRENSRLVNLDMN